MFLEVLVCICFRVSISTTSPYEPATIVTTHPVATTDQVTSSSDATDAVTNTEKISFSLSTLSTNVSDYEATTEYQQRPLTNQITFIVEDIKDSGSSLFVESEKEYPAETQGKQKLSTFKPGDKMKLYNYTTQVETESSSESDIKTEKTTVSVSVDTEKSHSPGRILVSVLKSYNSSNASKLLDIAEFDRSFRFNTNISADEDATIWSNISGSYDNKTVCDTLPCQDDNGGKGSISLTSKPQGTVKFISQGILSPLIAAPGCIFNVFNMRILAHHGSENSTTKFLIAMSVADILFLLVSLVRWALYMLETFNMSIYVWFTVMLHSPWFERFFSLTTGRISNAYIVVLTIERFIAVKSPMTAKESPFTRHPMKVIVAIAVFITAILVPNIFKTEYVLVEDKVLNTTTLSQRWTDFAESHKNFYVVYTYFLLVTLRLLPVALVIFFNTGIIVLLKLSNQSLTTEQVSDEKRKRREMKITRMLVAISIIFLVCIPPGVVYSTLANFAPNEFLTGTAGSIWATLKPIFPIMDIINSAANFFVYVLMSTKFRSMFLREFCSCVKLADQFIVDEST